MISVICVYNDEKALNNVLLKSLGVLTPDVDLVLIDNRSGRFKSASAALNYGGRIAKGDYLLFAHQDMWLGGASWMKETFSLLEKIPDLGIAGVAGVSEKGDIWMNRLKYAISIPDAAFAGHPPVTHPEDVQTLDECLLIIPKRVFSLLEFDEKVFDGWDCYGADYCMAVRSLGLKTYVIPAYCRHYCARKKFRIWEFRGLLKYQRRLYAKYKNQYNKIFTWMGVVSWPKLLMFSFFTHFGPLYFKCFPDIPQIIFKALDGCRTVLEIGCDHHSMIHGFQAEFSVAVGIEKNNLIENKMMGGHSEYIQSDLKQIEFQPKSFDAVIVNCDFKEFSGVGKFYMLDKAEKWAKNRFIVKIKNPNIKKGGETGTLSPPKWELSELKKRGFRVVGSGGWKNAASEKYLQQRIPRPIQRFLYHFPEQASIWILMKRIENW